MGWSVPDNALPLPARPCAWLAVGDGVAAEDAGRCRRLIEAALGVSPVAPADGAAPDPAPDLVVRLQAQAGAAPDVRVQALPGDGVEIVVRGDRLPDDRTLLAAVERAAWVLPDRARHLLDRFVVAWAPERDEVLALVVGDDFTTLDLRWAVRLLEQRFRYVGRLRLGVPPSAFERHRALFGDRYPMVPVDTARLEPHTRALVLVILASPKPTQLKAWVTQQTQVPLYEMNVHGFLWPIAWGRDKTTGNVARGVLTQGDWYPHADLNVFTRLAARRQITSFSVPPARGRLYANGIGPLDPLGYRNGGDFQRLAGRPREHLVVAMFGGSGCHGDKCFHDDTIAAALQRRLNARDAGDRRWTVLNFGICGFIQADEFQAYLATCLRVRPDVVISHSGNNDLYNGMICDPQILGKYDLIYPGEDFNRQHGEDERLKGRLSPPEMIVSAYLARARQFAVTAAAHDAHFVLGLQPLWYGKTLSPDELEAITVFASVTHADLFMPERLSRLPFLFDRLRARSRELVEKSGVLADRISVVDVHGHVANAPASCDAFADHFHMTADGNDLAAACYADALIDLLHAGRLPRLADEGVPA